MTIVFFCEETANEVANFVIRSLSGKINGSTAVLGYETTNAVFY